MSCTDIVCIEDANAVSVLRDIADQVKIDRLKNVY